MAGMFKRENMNHCSRYALSYGRFVATLGVLNKIMPMPMRMSAASLIGRVLDPDIQLNHKIKSNLQLFGVDSTGNFTNHGKVLESFHSNEGIAGLDHSPHARKTSDWLQKFVDIDGIEHLASSDQRATLVLTFHNHYKFLLPVALGLLGHSVSAMAIDWKLSEVGQCAKTAQVYRDFFCDIESYFNGGQFIYLDGSSPLATFKTVSRSLRKNHILISLNDIYHPISGSRHSELNFLKHRLRCPTGVVEKAKALEAQVLCAYIYWDRDLAKYRLVIRDLNSENDTQKIVQNYVDLLEIEIVRDPGFWEGWKLLQ